MATLVAIAYAGEPERAVSAAQDVAALPLVESADLQDVVAVTVEADGTVRLHQSTDLTSEDALEGALIGLVAGVVLTLPFPVLAPAAFAGATLGGSAIGAITGGVVGHYSDIGIDDDFVREVSAKLPSNSSALFVLLEGDQTDALLGELATCGGEILTTDLPDEKAEHLRRALRDAHRKSAP